MFGFGFGMSSFGGGRFGASSSHNGNSNYSVSITIDTPAGPAHAASSGAKPPGPSLFASLKSQIEDKVGPTEPDIQITHGPVTSHSYHFGDAPPFGLVGVHGMSDDGF